jgi:Ca2+-binding RTX toxin-like protein
MLIQKNVSLIRGLQELLGKPADADPEAVVFDPRTGADILIGGAGSDTITGKAGNDLIDGDAWLNVRVSVRNRLDPTQELFSVDSVAELKTRMLSGEINPGQLVIVREILSTATDDVDTAVYSGLRANYDVTRNDDGTWTVAHLRGTAADGTDRIRNIETLQFSDRAMNLTGEPAISDTTPTELRLLTALPGTIALFSGVPESAVSYQWQVASGTGFVNIAGATGPSFAPQQAQVGLALRVQASFTDLSGARRVVFSDPTEPVGDNITGTSVADTLTGTPYADELIGLGGADRLNGAAGADVMTGGNGSDTYVVDDAGDVINEGLNAGSDSVETALAAYTLGANLENLSFTGAGSFSGTGNELANELTGGSGDDILDGGAGIDRLVGGIGNDTYIVSDAGDTVVEALTQGQDLVRTTLGSLTLAANVEDLVYTGSGNFSGSGNGLANRLTGGAGDDLLDGAGGNDILEGLDGKDRLRGGIGNDTLNGGLGDDALDGGAGADVMSGGSGDDSYVVDQSGDRVVEAGGEGIDLVSTSLTSYTLGAALENLSFTGTGAFTGTGNALSNELRGRAGNDRLDGGAGVDVMIGGLGNDTYIVDEALDHVDEFLNQGIDAVNTTLNSYTLGANLENLNFTGGGAFVGEGNELANTLNGGNGNDRLDGAGGIDRLVGGAGDDIYVVDLATDVVVEATNRGTDLVLSSASNLTLAANVENLAYTGSASFTGVGNTLANTLTGGAGNDSLDGGTGNDRLVGGGGNDSYVVNAAADVIVEVAGEGIDTVFSTSAAYTLAAEVENLTQNGAAATLTGNALSNILKGGVGNDTLRGGAGNDRLEGRAGNDLLQDSEGNDIFVFGTPGFGADTVSGFDANPLGGQDLLDISGLGITAASFRSSVNIADLGADLRVTIGSFGSFVLQGVGDPATLTIDDFLLSGGTVPVFQSVTGPLPVV